MTDHQHCAVTIAALTTKIGEPEERIFDLQSDMTALLKDPKARLLTITNPSCDTDGPSNEQIEDMEIEKQIERQEEEARGEHDG